MSSGFSTWFDSNRAVQPKKPKKMDRVCLHDTAHFIIMLSQLISASMLNLALATCLTELRTGL